MSEGGGGEKREEGGVKGMDGVGKEMDVGVWRKLTEGMGVKEGRRGRKEE